VTEVIRYAVKSVLPPGES